MLRRLAWVCTCVALTIAPAQALAPRVDVAEVRVPVLVYHSLSGLAAGRTAEERLYDVSPAAFEAEMVYLRDHNFTVVPLSDLVCALVDGAPLPDRAVVITFDDGWATQYRNALPVLRRFGYTATFFVFTSAIGRDARFMTWNHLRELRDTGMTIGSHSRTHPYMTRLTPSAIRDEVAGSRATLEREIGAPIDFFAYPFGQHPPAVEEAVRGAGYTAARGFPGGAWNGPDRRWALHSVMATGSLAQFRHDVDPPR